MSSTEAQAPPRRRRKKRRSGDRFCAAIPGFVPSDKPTRCASASTEQTQAHAGRAPSWRCPVSAKREAPGSATCSASGHRPTLHFRSPNSHTQYGWPGVRSPCRDGPSCLTIRLVRSIARRKVPALPLPALHIRIARFPVDERWESRLKIGGPEASFRCPSLFLGSAVITR